MSVLPSHDLIIGLPEAKPNEKSEKRVRRKTTKWWMRNPKGVACPVPPAMGTII